MLTESFYVRRVKKNIDPQTKQLLSVEPIEDGELGLVRSLEVSAVPEQASPSGFKLATMLGVCWEKSNYPAISFEDPADLQHMDDALAQVIDRLEADYGSQFLHEMIRKAHEVLGTEAIIETLKSLDAEETEETEEEEGEQEGSGIQLEGQPAH